MKKIRKMILSTLCILIVSSLVACSQDANQVEEREGEEAGQLKTFTYATAVDLSNLTPLWMSAENESACGLVYDTLLKYEAGEIKENLAKEWSFNEEGTALTLKLREDVIFHDGTPFNGQTVKKNLEFFSQNPNAGFILAVGMLEKVDLIGDYEVVLHFKSPYFAYLNDLCQQDVMVMVQPDMIEEGNFQLMKGVIGTGPYKLAEQVDGEYTRFVKNDDYWDETYAYHYDEVVVKVIHESTSRLQALQNGEIDAVFGGAYVSHDDFQQVQSIAGLEGVWSEDYREARTLVVNAGNPLLADLRVREAIEYAIDKKALSLGLCNGVEDVAYDMFPQAMPYSQADMKTRVFDVKKANALLDEAGAVMNEETGIRELNGQPMQIVFTYDSGEVLNSQLATMISSQLKEVGIQVESTGQDMYTWWMGSVEGAYGLTIWNVPLTPYAVPHLNLTPRVNSTPHTPAIKALKDGQTCFDAILAFTSTNDKTEVLEAIKYVLEYDDKNVISIPLTYSKEPFIYRTEAVAGYEFSGATRFFMLDRVIPKK